MEKPILFYDVTVRANRMTGGFVYVPIIVEREEAVPLDAIIEKAIDRGLIAGLKPRASPRRSRGSSPSGAGSSSGSTSTEGRTSPARSTRTGG